MKALVVQKDGEGLEALMGQRITLFCMNYIYTGKLVGVNATCVKLSDPAIVYETGDPTNAAKRRWNGWCAMGCPKAIFTCGRLATTGTIMW